MMEILAREVPLFFFVLAPPVLGILIGTIVLGLDMVRRTREMIHAMNREQDNIPFQVWHITDESGQHDNFQMGVGPSKR